MTASSQNAEVKALVKFMTQFLGFLQGQIGAIRREMTSVVDDVMSGVSSLNQAQIQAQKTAMEIIIKDEKEGFQAISPEERSKAEVHMLEDHHMDVEQMIADNVKKAGTQLKEYMQELKNLDSSLEVHLLTMMGALSSDDVVGQRLEHVAFALKILQKQLSKILDDFEKHFSLTGVDHFKKTIHEEVFKKYTMQEEKECFIKVLGYAPKKQS